MRRTAGFLRTNLLGAIYKIAGNASLIPIPADPGFNTASANPTSVLSLQLPAGSYWLTGTLSGQDTAPATSYALDCAVLNGATALDVAHGTFLSGQNNNVPFVFAAPLTLASPGAVSVKCDSSHSSNVQEVRLAAIEVPSLTQSS